MITKLWLIGLTLKDVWLTPRLPDQIAALVRGLAAPAGTSTVDTSFLTGLPAAQVAVGIIAVLFGALALLPLVCGDDPIRSASGTGAAEDGETITPRKPRAL